MTDGPSGAQRPRWVNALILAVGFGIFVSLLMLGNWQMRRLDWKVNLIEAVEARVHADAVSPPKDTVSEADHAYLRVYAPGRFSHESALRVKAVTELGLGNWVMTPLVTDTRTIWVNRGFIPAGFSADTISTPSEPVVVTGLLRMTEPGGTFLESNQPEAGRWVSRDVQGLSEAVGIVDHAPFFIDADHSGAADGWPRGGLTIIAFRNDHLSYALTWYAMAALFLAGMVFVIFDTYRSKRSSHT
ncbi:MAG: SURF1 family protein [Pseudomonadota bacterium]